MPEIISIAALSGENALWYLDARRLLDHYGFTEHRNGWLKRGDVYVFVDSDRSPVNARFFGFYRMRLNQDGKEMMHSIAMVPWYGDGEDRVPAFQIATVVINLLVYGAEAT